MVNISVVIPVYNVEPYIKECIESVMQQSMTDGVECILVDDCGTDKSIEIAESLIATYQGNIKFKILHHKENKHVGGARNTGIDAAEGEYIFFMDSDDYITSDCLDSLWEMAKKYPKADVVHGVKFTEKDAIENFLFHRCINKYKLPEYSDDVNYVRRETVLNHYALEVFNSLFKSKLIKDNNLKFLEHVVFEDYPWVMNISRKVSAVAFCPKDTYYYRLRSSSIVGSMSPKYLNCVASNSDYMMDNISVDGFFKTELFHIMEFMHIYDEKFSTSPIELMRYGKNRIFRKVYQLSYQSLGFFGRLEKSLLVCLLKIQMRYK